LKRVARATLARVIIFSARIAGEDPKMDFQVHEQTYFLGLSGDERRWLFFVSTPRGMQPIPIYEDAPDLGSHPVLQEEKQRVPN